MQPDDDNVTRLPLIITIHGIRCQTKWYKELEGFEEFKGRARFAHFEYDYLDLLRFVFPGARRKVIRDFQEFYSDHCDSSHKSPSVVCHSFGTYIFFSAIDTYDAIKFENVVLCGSILNPEMKWERFFKNQQIKRFFHDFGAMDSFVKWSKWVLGKNSGNSGEIGFTKISAKLKNKKQVVQKENDNFHHSHYFLPIHMKTYWIPFLLSSKAKPSFRFNPAILRQEVVDRIYFDESNDHLSITSMVFCARIDSQGNYYAQYTRQGINETPESFIRHVNIATAADTVLGFN